MIAAIIFLMIFGIIFITIGFSLLMDIESDMFGGLFGGAFFLFLGIALVIVSHRVAYDSGHRNGQIDALNEKQMYEKVYHYINKDTIPHDTTYVLKEEYENE